MLDKEKQREVSRKHYLKNKEKRKIQNKEWRASHPEVIEKYIEKKRRICIGNKILRDQRRMVREKNRRKERSALTQEAIKYLGGKCVDCGVVCNFGEISNAVIFDFHHVIFPKIGEISIMVKSMNFESIKIEIDKCVLLCANCHRLRHHREGIQIRSFNHVDDKIADFPLLVYMEEATA